MAKRTYVARYERDENDYWAVTVQVGPKKVAISDGQTLEKARRRIRQALAVLLDVAEDTFEIQDDVRLPAAKPSLCSSTLRKTPSRFKTTCACQLELERRSAPTSRLKPQRVRRMKNWILLVAKRPVLWTDTA